MMSMQSVYPECTGHTLYDTLSVLVSAILFLVIPSLATADTANEITSCMKPLLAIPQDTVLTLTLEDQRSMMVYRAWQSNFKTQQEAKEQGINLDVVYDTLNITGSAQEKFNTYLREKNERSEQYFHANSSQHANLLISNLNNVEVVKIFGQSVNKCITSIAEGSGRYCSVVPIGANQLSVNLSARYAFQQPIATINEAKALATLGSTTREIVLWEQNEQVLPTGIQKTLARNPDETISFTINTSLGSFPCDSAHPVPRYTVAGKISGTRREIKKQTEDRALLTIQHIQCVQFDIKHAQEVCMPGDANLVDVQLSPNTPLNPHLYQAGEFSLCFRPRLEGWAIVPGKPYCGVVSRAVQECWASLSFVGTHGPLVPLPTPQVWNACQYAKTHGTPMAVSLTYTQEKTVPLDEFSFIRESVDSVVSIKYGHALPALDKVDLQYEVTIINLRNGAGLQLSTAKPASSETGASTSLDASQQLLVVILPTK